MEVKHKERKEEFEVKKKDNSKMYFFVIAIVTLLLTNVYFYVKFKSSGEKLYTTALQKEGLQREIDRIEAALDDIQNQSRDVVMPAELVNNQQKARDVIADLRKALEQVELSDAQIQQTDEQVAVLKVQVASLKNQLGDLKLQNEILAKENEKLASSVSEKSTQVNDLRQDNATLRGKVSVASSIKVSNILINGLEVKRRGNKEIETKAKRVDELQIEFTVADNELAKKEHKNVFVRVVDPNGYLIADGKNVFMVHGDELQYTFKEKIAFTNKGEAYEFLWNNNKQGFKKGAYTVLLYADNAIMGRSSIVLK